FFQNDSDVFVTEPGNDRGDADADGDAGPGQATDDFDPTTGGRDVGLDDPGVMLIPEGDAHAHADPATLGQLQKDVDVALNQGRLGDDGHGVAVCGADLQALPGEAKGCLQRLVAVGDSAEHQKLAPPRGSLEGFAQQLGGAQLHHDLRFEIRTRAKA